MSQRPTDERLERGMSIVLVVGVVISALLVAAGFGASFVVGWNGALLGSAPAATDMTDFSGLLPRLGVLQPLAVTQLGLLVLIGTPVLRVAVSIAGFAAERDWFYVAVTAIVLALLLLSLVVLR